MFKKHVLFYSSDENPNLQIFIFVVYSETLKPNKKLNDYKLSWT